MILNKGSSSTNTNIDKQAIIIKKYENDDEVTYMHNLYYGQLEFLRTAMHTIIIIIM